MKPVCVPCQRFMRMKESGFAFIEGMPATNGTPPGKREPENWRPYKLWFGDLYACPDCGATIVTGFGLRPRAEHFEPDFTEQVRAHSADQLQVNDC